MTPNPNHHRHSSAYLSFRRGLQTPLPGWLARNLRNCNLIRKRIAIGLCCVFFLFKLCKISTFPLEKKIILNNKGSIKKHLVAKHRNFLVKIRNSIMDTDISLFLGQRVVIKRYCVVHHTPARGNMKIFRLCVAGKSQDRFAI